MRNRQFWKMWKVSSRQPEKRKSLSAWRTSSRREESSEKCSKREKKNSQERRRRVRK